MIYVPNLSDYSCVVVIDKDTIRAYKNTPELNSNVNYDDIYINSHYIHNSGTELITTEPICMTNDVLTDEVYYRNDFPSILLTFVLLAFICFYLPTRLLFKLFRKRGV